MSKWAADKYADCKTWTVFDERGTIASRVTEEHAKQIIREHNSHGALVEKLADMMQWMETVPFQYRMHQGQINTAKQALALARGESGGQ